MLTIGNVDRLLSVACFQHTVTQYFESLLQQQPRVVVVFHNHYGGRGFFVCHSQTLAVPQSRHFNVFKPCRGLRCFIGTRSVRPGYVQDLLQGESVHTRAQIPARPPLAIAKAAKYRAWHTCWSHSTTLELGKLFYYLCRPRREQDRLSPRRETPRMSRVSSPHRSIVDIRQLLPPQVVCQK